MATTRTDDVELTPTQSKWLAEIQTCEHSGEVLKHYAARKGLSIHTLYQAKRILRKKGVLPAPSRSPAKRGGKKAPVRRDSKLPFAQVVHRAEVRDPGIVWRLRLPGGLIFESHTPLAIDDLLRLARGLGGRS